MTTKRTERAQRGAGTSKAEAKAAKELLFVDYYLANGCIGAKAYLQAGYRAKNAHVAAVMANRLLRKPDIAELIKERNRKRLETAKLTANETMQSMARDLKFDPSVCFHDNGEPKPIHEIPPEARQSLRGYKRDKDGVVEFKFPEKTAVREQAMKHFGLYERDNKQKPFYVPPVIKVIPVQPVPRPALRIQEKEVVDGGSD